MQLRDELQPGGRYTHTPSSVYSSISPCRVQDAGNTYKLLLFRTSSSCPLNLVTLDCSGTHETVNAHDSHKCCHHQTASACSRTSVPSAIDCLPPSHLYPIRLHPTLLVKLRSCLQSFPMSSTSLLRVAARKPQASWFRAQPSVVRKLSPMRSTPAIAVQPANSFSSSVKRMSDQHGEETFEEFSAR